MGGNDNYLYMPWNGTLELTSNLPTLADVTDLRFTADGVESLTVAFMNGLNTVKNFSVRTNNVLLMLCCIFNFKPMKFDNKVQ